jgi:hypothetical protein
VKTPQSVVRVFMPAPLGVIGCLFAAAIPFIASMQNATCSSTSEARMAALRCAARGPQARGKGFPTNSFHSFASLTPDFHPVTRKSRASGTPAEVRGLKGHSSAESASAMRRRPQPRAGVRHEF